MTHILPPILYDISPSPINICSLFLSLTPPSSQYPRPAQKIMDERTFHLFPQLPPELREQIWLMAIRPDKPGVHTFRLYHPELDNSRHAQDIIGFAPKKPSFWHRQNIPPCPYRLALPAWNKYPDSTDGSSDHDISTYLIDSSLWSVCQESRSMMKRVFKEDNASSRRLLASTTAHYLSGSATSYITIHPRKDLIVLQFDDMLKFNWDFLDVLFHTNKWFPDGVVNLGIEYNIEWGMDIDASPYDKLAELACGSWVSTNIWLIDHNLKRREGTCHQKDSLKRSYKYPELNEPFYANDRTFIKVNLRKKDDCMDHWKYLKLISERFLYLFY
ncbi:uncharacterized protein FFB14_10221 [Fusarium fujikuroi]|nr:uncharacterized protein FFB14_10221 [Fusarium fujikuroi]